MSTATVAQKIVSTENQNKTPKEQAAEIIKDAFEDKLVSIGGTTFQKLTTVVRYLNRDKLQARGETWFTKNFDSLCSDALDDLIKAREKAITSYLAKKEEDEKNEAFKELVAKGMAVPDAYAKVYTK